MPLFIGDIDQMWKLYGALPPIHRAIYVRAKFPNRAVLAWGKVLDKWGSALRVKAI